MLRLLLTLLGLLAAHGTPPTAAPTPAWQPVQALDGGNDNYPATTCITDPDTTLVDDVPIAAQCCDPSISGDAGCRRKTDTNNDEGCIGGKPPREYTFAQAAQLCDAAGLIMCDRSCEDEGCNYNGEPVPAARFEPCVCLCRAEPQIPGNRRASRRCGRT